MLYTLPAADVTESRVVRRAAKVSNTNLPQEYQLARLVRNVENSFSSWNTSTPACEWYGVDCNKEGEIMSIKWPMSKLKGSLSFRYLPETMHTFYAYVNELSGDVPLGTLSSSLHRLSLRDNELSGTLDLAALPLNLTTLILSGNRFTGEVCLTRLPSGLLNLCLGRNMLSGELYLNELPNVIMLRLENNNFSGNVDLSSLPASLDELDLSCNVNLSGEVKKSVLPEKLCSALRIRSTKIVRCAT